MNETGEQIQLQFPAVAERLREALERENDARCKAVEAEAAIRARCDLKPDEQKRLDAEQTAAVTQARQDLADAERAVLAELREVWSDAKPLDTDAILSGLGPDELLLCYSWSPDADLLLVAEPGKQPDAGVQVFFLADGKEMVEDLTALAQRVQDAITKHPEGQSASSLGRDIAKLLPRPLPVAVQRACASAHRLLVLPDGPLNVVPLEALLAKDQPGAAPGQACPEVV